jgi:hypothetical protein
MLLVEERELWTQFIDPEVDQPYKSMDRWIKTVCPKSWSYCYDALRTVKECRAIPFEDLLQIKRCNLETLKKASSNIRVKPKVIEAAKTQTEAQFAQTLSRDHGQHIETKSTLKLTYTAGEMAEVEKALDWVGKQAGIEDRAGQLLALCIDANIEHSEQDAA